MQNLKLTQLEKKFLNKGILRYGILILTPLVAQDFIIEANNNSYKILGIDGFFMFGDKIQPSMEFSTDYSEDLDNVAFKKALEFIEQNKNIKDANGNQLYFEVTVEQCFTKSVKNLI